MSDIIPQITLEQFRRLSAEQIKAMKAVEVCDVTGVYVFTAIIPHGDFFSHGYMRTQAEYLGNKANISGGKAPEELQPLSSAEERYAILARARAVLKEKREARVGV